MARATRLILDRYELLGTAGEGGFGTVQIAWDPRIQRKVAIKTIRLTELDAYRANLPGAQAVSVRANPTADRWHGATPWNEYLEGEANGYGGYLEDGLAFSSAPDALDAFGRPGALDGPDAPGAFDMPEQVTSLSHLPGLDEARTAAKLSDPRIVTVYDFEVRVRTAYLIMEYVEGITLTRLLADYPDFLTLDMVAAVFDAMAGALAVAHKAGVLHLDIKPDNIIINTQGQAKVTDFGLATLADASGAGTTGGGTIGYMPLEQMRREHLDARTDEWSLAAVTYEMLTGDNPFRVASLDQAEAAIEDAELVLPSLCWNGLDEQVDDVVFYALDPDREERYASVADFAEEMQKFLGDAENGRDQLSLVVADALGMAMVEGEDPEGEWEGEAAPVKRPRGLLDRLFGPACGTAAADSADDAPFDDYDGGLGYDEPDYGEPKYDEPSQSRRAREKARKDPSKKRGPLLRVVLAYLAIMVCGGLATWFALGNLPAMPTAFGLDPTFFKVVVSLAMAAICAILPRAGLAIAFAFLILSFIPRFL